MRPGPDGPARTDAAKAESAKSPPQPLPATPPKRISAIERLQALGPLFRGSELTVRFGWTSAQASHYLWLWRCRSLVKSLGGHSDVHANLLANAQPNWEAAALMAMPSAVIHGVECLRRAGWTTQIPHRPEVAVLGGEGQPLYSCEQFDVTARPAGWFRKVRHGLSRTGENALPHARTMPTLRPAWALAEMLRHGGWGACGLQPDDIDWGLAQDRDRADWVRASKVLGVKDPVADEALAAEPEHEGAAEAAVQRER